MPISPYKGGKSKRHFTLSDQASNHLSAIAGDARLRLNRQVDGLATDPIAGAGALHPKPQGTAKAGADLVLDS